jgi:uncharacterized membrane protein
MFAAEISEGSLWWLFLIVMIILCFFTMRKRNGAVICGFRPRREDKQGIKATDSAKAILDKRFALDEIDKKEYEEKKQLINSGI